MSLNYPYVKRNESNSRSYHDTEVSDPYEWLEDSECEETKAFIENQNLISSLYLQSCPNRDAIRSSLIEWWNYPRYYEPFREGERYFQFRNTGLQNQNVLYYHETLAGLHNSARVFMDPNELSTEGTFSLHDVEFSPNGKIMAYRLTKMGSDWTEIRFKVVETREDLKDVLYKCRFSTMSWMSDNEGFFYSAYLSHKGKSSSGYLITQNQKLYYHKLGTKQATDVMVVSPQNANERIAGMVSFCGNFLIICGRVDTKKNSVDIVDLRTAMPIKSLLDLTTLVPHHQFSYKYITNLDKKFIFLTNNEAPTYRLVSVDVTNPKEWNTLIPPDPKHVLVDCRAINKHQMVILYLRDVKHVMQLHELNTGKKLLDLILEIGTVVSISGKRDHTEMFYNFTSFTTPGSIYSRIDFSAPHIKPVVYQEARMVNLKPMNYDTKQIFYQSKDGTKVPMFLFHKKGLINNGINPCVLYSYGSFGTPITCTFSVTRLCFVNFFNGIFAIANIRGGGEYGSEWHDAGRGINKQNAVDDFQFAAKHLFTNKYTNASKLIVQGQCSGGLIVGASINQTPELFAAAIIQMGVLDLLRFDKFTIGFAWTGEYGSPGDKNQFSHLVNISPVHNVKTPAKANIQYPAILLLAAENDDRVVPMHSFKFISELQHTIGSSPYQKQPLLLRIESDSGHGIGKPTSKVIEEYIDIFSFMCKVLELRFNSKI